MIGYRPVIELQCEFVVVYIRSFAGGVVVELIEKIETQVGNNGIVEAGSKEPTIGPKALPAGNR